MFLVSYTRQKYNRINEQSRYMTMLNTSVVSIARSTLGSIRVPYMHETRERKEYTRRTLKYFHTSHAMIEGRIEEN